MTKDSLIPGRIASIDALRGFDMLMIIFADRFFSTLHKGSGSGITESLANQFDHPEWFGSSFYDIIMPLFLFVVGAVIPFSLSKRIQSNNSNLAIYKKLIRRFVILFILGWIVQGNLLALDVSQFHVFANTLQAIAVGYVLAVLPIFIWIKSGYMSFLERVWYCMLLYLLFPMYRAWEEAQLCLIKVLPCILIILFLEDLMTALNTPGSLLDWDLQPQFFQGFLQENS